MTAVARCIASFDSLEGTSTSFDDKDLKINYFKINIDPRQHFVDLVSECKVIPDAVKTALVNTILNLAKGHRVVLVSLKGRSECQFPENWISPLLAALFNHSIFVSTDRQYDGMSSYTKLDRMFALKKEDVMRMTENRASRSKLFIDGFQQTS